MELVVAENITKDYQVGEVTVGALKGASFNIEPASFVSFVGPSGSGKTTLLNLIGCLDKPSAGRLFVAGMDVSSFGKKDSAIFRGKNIGFIFQDFNLIPVLTVFENIEYPLLMVQNASPGDRKKRVMSLLGAVGMTEQKDKYPDQISGGQKHAQTRRQHVALCPQRGKTHPHYQPPIRDRRCIQQRGHSGPRLFGGI